MMSRQGTEPGLFTSGASRRNELRNERGYVTLSLVVMASMLVIAAAAVAPRIAFEIKRDRETELIHRAMEYRSAVRRFTKHTGRYPMTLDDLESTNGVRYLRRRYKDPITGRDFRLLHMSDIPAALGTSANAWSLQPAPKDTSGDSISPNDAASVSTTDQPSSNSSQNNSTNTNNQQPAPQPFTGGVIIGVASTSKEKTIREFDKRNRYNQWLFFYDPAYDRTFDVKGPTPLTHPPTAIQNASGPAGQQAQPSQPTPSNPSQQTSSVFSQSD